MSSPWATAGSDPGGRYGVPETYRWEIERFPVVGPKQNQKQ